MLNFYLRLGSTLYPRGYTEWVPMLTFKDRYLSSQSWLDRATIVNLYHVIMKQRQPKWNLEHTAKYFEISLGNVSGCMKIAENVDKVRECTGRNKALEVLKDA